MSDRLLKKSASGVLAGHCRLTISAAFTNVTHFSQRVVNLRGLLCRCAAMPDACSSALASLSAFLCLPRKIPFPLDPAGGIFSLPYVQAQGEHHH